MSSANIRNVIHINPKFTNSVDLISTSNLEESKELLSSATHFNPLFLQQPQYQQPEHCQNYQQQQQPQQQHNVQYCYLQPNSAYYHNYHDQIQHANQKDNTNMVKHLTRQETKNLEKNCIQNIHMNPKFILNLSNICAQQDIQILSENSAQKKITYSKPNEIFGMNMSNLVNDDDKSTFPNCENISYHLKNDSYCHSSNLVSELQQITKKTDNSNIGILKDPNPPFTLNNLYTRKTKTQLIRASNTILDERICNSRKLLTITNSNQINTKIIKNSVEKKYISQTVGNCSVMNANSVKFCDTNLSPQLETNETLSTTTTTTADNCVSLNTNRNKYKIDRRKPIEKKVIDKILTTKSHRITTMKVLKTNKILVINGLIYKSTANSLKLKNALKLFRSQRVISKYNGALSNKKFVLKKKKENNNGKTKNELIIYVGGTRYIMDGNKRRLIRSNIETNIKKNRKNINSQEAKLLTKSPPKSPIKLLDNSIENCNQNIRSARNCNSLRSSIQPYTYIRNNISHLTRAYINNAKQKSLQTLVKRKNMVKSNITCPIYKKLGKCVAYERGKCNKLHNKLQVNICYKYIRGECNNPNCLLSHLATFAKMPVCKFYLLGRCIRKDCLYLHKKLSNNAQLCPDFTRGYCAAAEKCNMRHELVCINNGCIGKCSKNCYRCKNSQYKKDEKETKESTTANSHCNLLTEENPENSENIEESSADDQKSVKDNRRMDRYFLSADNESENAVNSECVDNYITINRNTKLQQQPSYIPI